MRWDVTEDLRLRAAAFRTLKPDLVNNRTIEPTQVAGFNQFFDDANGTLFWRYGGGFDWRISRSLFLGGEITWRNIDEPVSDVNREGSEVVLSENRAEQLHNLYLFWTPTERLAVRTEFVYDLYRAERGAATEGGLPELAETFSAPITVGYFHPAGFFARLGGSFVHQRVVRATTEGSGNDSFFLVDTDLGYRLPRRLGAVSVGVKNLFDRRFRYQDDSYREFRDEPAIGPYFPERIIMGRLVLNF